MGKVEIEKTDRLQRPPALVCYQECEEIRLAELAEKGPEHESHKKFADMSGQLKIVVVNPTPCKDCLERFWSAVLSFGNMLIGIVVFAVMIFSAGEYLEDIEERWDKLHVPLCTVGFVMMSGPGIMTINSVFGPSAQMKPKRRLIEHILMMAFGFLFAVVGGVICLGLKEDINWLGYHCLAGLVSYALGTIGFSTGIVAALVKKPKILSIFTVLHLTTGMLAFLAYMGCFVTGILCSKFRAWAREVISWYYRVLMTMVLLFTIIILFVPCLKCCQNCKKCRKLTKRKCHKGQVAAYVIAERQKEDYLKYLKEAEAERLLEEKERATDALKYQKVQNPPRNRY